MTFQHFDRDWADPTYKLARLAVIALAIVIGYPYIPGSSSEAFKGISIFFGVLVSLGASSIVANAIAGFTMIYRRAFREGDMVRYGDILGRVTKVRLMVTHLRTPKNEEVVLPNSKLLADEIVNYSTLAQDHGLILHTRSTSVTGRRGARSRRCCWRRRGARPAWSPSRRRTCC